MQIRAALNRVIDSELFRSSPQLASFLRFVVEAVLRGEAKRIKGYTIGIEALGRGPGFNPQVDPIVRVEATRLRRTMERYYAGPGVNDPIIIGLLRGSYVPTFRRRGARGAARAPGATSPPTTPRARISRFTLICFAAALALGAIAYTAVEWWNHVENPPTSSSTPVVAPGRDPLAGAVRSGNGMPTIGVQPFETIGTPQTQHISSETLQEKVHDALSLFDTINIEFEPPRGRTPAAHRGQTSLDYRLFGTIEHRNDGSVEVRFRLLDTADGKSVWSRTFEPFPATEDREAIMERIIFHLATTLMQPYGVVRAHERIKYLSSSAGDPRNRCVVETLEALRSFIPSEYNDARACLERLTAMDQSFSIGFGYLSAVYIFRYQLGRDERPDDRALLDQALLVARRAVEIDPESSLAHQILFNALFVRGEIAAAFAAADKAIALNKYNLFTQITIRRPACHGRRGRAWNAKAPAIGGIRLRPHALASSFSFSRALSPR